KAVGEGVRGLQVCARAEGDAAGAGQHQSACFVVLLEAQVGLVQGLGGGPVDGIAAVLAVDRYERRGADSLIADRSCALAAVAHKGPTPGRGARPPFTSLRARWRRAAKPLCGPPCAFQDAAGSCSSRTRTRGRR